MEKAIKTNLLILEEENTPKLSHHHLHEKMNDSEVTEAIIPVSSVFHYHSLKNTTDSIVDISIYLNCMSSSPYQFIILIRNHL